MRASWAFAACLVVVLASLPTVEAGALARPGGAVVLAFDDGCASARDAAAMLEARGWRGTFYAITGAPPPDVCQAQLTRAQLGALAARGHDVEAHTVTHPHLASLSEAAVRDQLARSQADLATLVGRAVPHFAYPYGEFSPAVEAVARERFDTARLYYVDLAAMPSDAANPHHLPAFGVRAATTLAEVDAALARAARDGVAMILVFHDVSPTPGAYDTTPGFLDAVLERIAQRGLPVLTLAEAMGSSSALRFAPRNGNEWWAQVALSGADAPRVVSVESRDSGGAWIMLTKRSWGDWAGSYHVEPGHLVEYRARLADGRLVGTCAYRHPSAACDGSAAFSATFRNVRGNAWWVESDVTASGGTLAGVDARVDGGAWVALSKKEWGSWAKSLHAPPGSQVEFRARGTDGHHAVSAAYPWPPG